MNSESNIKIGLIGCGSWGKNILRDLKLLNVCVTVVAPYSQDKINAKLLGADFIFDCLEEITHVDGFNQFRGHSDILRKTVVCKR